MEMKKFGRGAALAGALLSTEPALAEAPNSMTPEVTPIVALDSEYTPESVEALIAEIEATRAATAEACREAYRGNDAVEGHGSRATYGKCRLEAAKESSEALANLQAALNRQFEAISLEHANLQQFLNILYQLQLAAAEAGNDAAIARIQDLRAEALATMTSAETIEEMTVRLEAEADRLEASADEHAASADAHAASADAHAESADAHAASADAHAASADEHAASADAHAASADAHAASADAFAAQAARYEAEIQAIWRDIASSDI